ncbi:hypothetical protein BUE80_DR001684 [Diplocarpon rosae]|nr:hypothetical protein BUE80_DR001684 [Diplocarpon rosae]
MEKIKNFLSSSSSKNEDTNQAQAQTQSHSSTTHGSGLTGEGSHLQSAADTGTNPTPSSLPGPAASHGSLGGQSTAHSGEGSHLAGATSGQKTQTQTQSNVSHTGLVDRSSNRHDASNTSSGLPAGSEHSGISAGTATGTSLATSTSTTTSPKGPHSSPLANRADPRVDSDNAGGTPSGLGIKTSTLASGSTSNTAPSGLSQHPVVSAGTSTTHPADTTAQSKNLGNAQIGGSAASIGQRALASVTGAPSSHPETGSGPSAPPMTHTGSNSHAQTRVPGQWVDEGSTGAGLSGAGAGVGLGSTSGSSGLAHGSQSSNPSPQQTSANSGSHVGRDAAAVGAAGIAGSGIHSHRENERSVGSTGSSGLAHGTQSSHAYPEQTSSTSGSRFGRDAAAVGAAGVIGSGIHSHGHESALGSNVGSSGLAHNTPSSSSHTGYGTLQGHSTTTAGHGPNTGSSALTRNTEYGTNHGSNPTGGSQLGRDAALLGTAGAVGADMHHHHENQRALVSSVGSTGVSQGNSPATGSHGPHTTDTANLLDPSVNTRGAGQEDALHHSPRHGGGAEEADTHHRASDVKTGSAAAVDATRRAGVGAGNTSGLGHSAGATGPAPHTAGPHAKDYQNVLDPRVTPQNAAIQGSEQTGILNTTGSSGHHYGRDAAVAGGVGTAAYAAGHHGSSVSGVNDPSRVGQQGSSTIRGPQYTPGTTSTTQPGSTTHHSAVDSITDRSRDHHLGRDVEVAGGAGTATYATGYHSSSAGGVSGPSQVGQQGSSTIRGPQHTLGTATAQHSAADPTTDRSRHHDGRAVAVAGGVGGAAYEANKHSHEKEITRAQKEVEKEHRHDVKEAEKDHKHAEKHEEKEKKHGFLSFLHRDKSKKYSKEEEEDFDRQEREHNASQSHTGRNAALGGAAVGAGAGAAAYGHHEAGTNKPLPTAPGNHGIGTGAGTHNALAGNTSNTHDANVIGTGGHGAGKFEVHHDATTKTPLDQKPVGKDIGDHLHGDRNRGVQGASGFAGEPGYGDGTTGRDHGGLLHDHDHSSKHSISPGNTPISSGHGTGHVGPDAAVPGRAGVAGTGLAEHGHRTAGDTHPQSGLTSSHGQSGLTGPSSSVDTGRAFPLAGAGEHGHGRHDSGYPHDKTSPTYATPHPTASSGLEQDYKPSDASHPKTSDLSGRNRLHKDRPAGYPGYSGTGAGDMHVPGSDSERLHLVGEGRRD